MRGGPARASARAATSPSPSTGGPSANDRLEPRDRLAVAGALASGRSSTSSRSGPMRRVLVGDPGQQQLLEAVRRRLGLRAAARELLAEPVEQPVGVRAEARLEIGQGGRGSRRAGAPPRTGRSAGGRPRGAGRARRSRRPGPTARRRLARRSSARPAGGSRRGRRRPGRRGVPSSGPSTAYRSRGSRRTWKSRHRSIVRAGASPKHGTLAGPADRPRAVGSGRRRPPRGRAAATCSIARRSSSSPDGSKS